MKETVEMIMELGLRADRIAERVIREVLGDNKKYFKGASSVSWFKVLALISKESDGAKYSNLVKQTGLAKSTLSILLSNMCDKGLIKKEVRGSIQNTYVELTDLGRKFAGVYDEILERMSSELLKDLSSTERKEFKEYLKIIYG